MAGANLAGHVAEVDHAADTAADAGTESVEVCESGGIVAARRDEKAEDVDGGMDDAVVVDGVIDDEDEEVGDEMFGCGGVVTADALGVVDGKKEVDDAEIVGWEVVEDEVDEDGVGVMEVEAADGKE